MTSNLDLADQRDFENSRKGFIATLEQSKILRSNGQSAFDLGAYEFVQGDAPATVNPSLWRQSKLLAKHGLFEVTSGIYQVRGFDLSNITFIRGDTGWIVVDPLVSAETAMAAKTLVDQELGKWPVSALIITHSHADHFGGIRGIVSETQVANGLDIIAPAGFLYESINENILAGNAMSRRVSYMFGGLLPKDAKHQVGVGLGQGVSSGSLGLIAPTVEIKNGERRIVDGVEIEFILALESEATSEFMFYLPKFKAFCQAEVINHTFHNMYTPRGAKVRDGRLWSSYIDEAIYTYGDKTEVSFGSHHWPVWGRRDVLDLWTGQRDLYRYVHDQTLRLANQGHTLHEIPDLIKLPDGIANNFANRSYYGTVSHNAKSQYQLYFGYFDGNPANLDPLPPIEHAAKFVEYAGGPVALQQKAQADFDAGEFRFAATALNHLVFAQPENRDARELLAQTYTQLAYILRNQGPGAIST
nr:LOW QUALITY PROTEIN: linear primary-alkylsulfatase-like [Nerophis lumbriciformis]